MGPRKVPSYRERNFPTAIVPLKAKANIYNAHSVLSVLLVYLQSTVYINRRDSRYDKLSDKWAQPDHTPKGVGSPDVG